MGRREMQIIIKLHKTGQVIHAISYGFGAVDVKGNMYGKKSYTVIQVIK
jgi:hypothetical protein